MIIFVTPNGSAKVFKSQLDGSLSQSLTYQARGAAIKKVLQ